MGEHGTEKGAGFTNVRCEYGLIEDRTSYGHGYCLLGTYPTRKHAENAATVRRSQQPRTLPLTVKVRTVATTDWRPTPPGETTP